MRTVKKIYRPNSCHWVGDGFLVHPLFSHMGENRSTDPFLMLDYAAPNHFPPSSKNKPRGVGAHPHKGFETVTIAYQGEVAHRDSTGNGGVIRPGDVQWMTAGAGIVHQEFHSADFTEKGGTLEMVQLWVNLPARNKNAPPHYQHLSSTTIPSIPLSGGSGRLRLIAGQYGNLNGPAQTHTEINVWDILLPTGSNTELDIPANHNLGIAVLHGSLSINNGDRADTGSWISFHQNGTTFRLHAENEDTHLLLLSGIPINEPLAAYGPFVMNTEEEIRQAITAFHNGSFGNIT